MLIVKEGYRLGGIPRPYTTHIEENINMQIPDEIRRCVVFIACKTQQGFKMIGTGFFCGINSEDQEFHFRYLVTAKHVLAKLQESKINIDDNLWIRVNVRSGGFEYVPIPFSHWLSHPDSNISVDVIACLDVLDPRKYDYLTIPFTMFMTSDVMKQKYVGIGDEVFTTGLFINHFGKHRNIPIIRVGNISALDEEPIQASKFSNMDAYLIETRSLGGLSGSPVFVHLSGSRTSFDGQTTEMYAGHVFYLFGLMHGHWTLSDATQDVILEDYVDAKDSHTGVGIVVPFSKIAETLQQEVFQNIRNKIVTEEKKRRQPIEDSIQKISPDFERLIDKAIKRSPKDD